MESLWGHTEVTLDTSGSLWSHIGVSWGCLPHAGACLLMGGDRALGREVGPYGGRCGFKGVSVALWVGVGPNRIDMA